MAERNKLTFEHFDDNLCMDSLDLCKNLSDKKLDDLSLGHFNEPAKHDSLSDVKSLKII